MDTYQFCPQVFGQDYSWVLPQHRDAGSTTLHVLEGEKQKKYLVIDTNDHKREFPFWCLLAVWPQAGTQPLWAPVASSVNEDNNEAPPDQSSHCVCMDSVKRLPQCLAHSRCLINNNIATAHIIWPWLCAMCCSHLNLNKSQEGVLYHPHFPDKRIETRKSVLNNDLNYRLNKWFHAPGVPNYLATLLTASMVFVTSDYYLITLTEYFSLTYF